MLLPRRLAPLLALLGALLIPASAGAAPFDPTGFRFSSPTFTVSESAGAATITITRTDTGREGQIRYFTGFGTAVRYTDYKPVKDMIDFAPGRRARPSAFRSSITTSRACRGASSSRCSARRRSGSPIPRPRC